MKIRLVPSNCLLLVLAAILLACQSCRKETDEDKVRNTIRSVQKAAENKDVREMLAHISKKYNDPQGNDYEEIKGIIVFYFFRHQKITVFLNYLQIAVNGQSAEAAFEAVLSGGGSPGTILPEALGAYRFNVSFTKESGDWKVISAGWERPGEGIKEDQ
jgi:ketosteroid isomerase-like protein